MTNPPWTTSFSKSFRIGDSARRQNTSSIQHSRQYNAPSSAAPAAAMPRKPSHQQPPSRFTASRSDGMTRPNRPAPARGTPDTTKVGESGTGPVTFSQSSVQGISIPTFIPSAENRSYHVSSYKSCHSNDECHDSNCHEHSRKERQSEYRLYGR